VIPGRLVLATKNPDKVAEMRAVLERVLPGVEIVEGLDWVDVAETGTTLEQNAVLKARAVAAATGLPALADDTGLEVAALDGAPGVHTARFAGPSATYAENRNALLAALHGVDDRRARFRTVVALAVEGRVITAAGTVAGVIAVAERGSEGFGYDPIFEVRGRTLAELGTAAKNQFSHRARALQALAHKLLRGDEAPGRDSGGGVPWTQDREAT
jgi:XTP/dITP diphosphohydrolase